MKEPRSRTLRKERKGRGEVRDGAREERDGGCTSNREKSSGGALMLAYVL